MYYSISNDINRYPDAWLYIITGGRARGKTYSTLLDCYRNRDRRDFVFIKRTLEDVDNLCIGTGNINKRGNDHGLNMSPFAAINRDTGSSVNAYSIKKGIGGFWETVTDDEGSLQPVGSPIGTIFALNGVTKYKGFEIASAKPEQWIIFDEFIPNVYDRVNINEGLQLLDFYKTVSRDRVQRGLEEVKLICLANATMVANPVFQTMAITDTVAEMSAKNIAEHYDQERGIYIHLLEDDPEFESAEAQTGLYKAMRNTPWGAMTYGNQFAYNDFSSVKKHTLKNFRCCCGFIYKDRTAFVYFYNGDYYISKARSDKAYRIYDLSRENEQKAFWLDWVLTIRNACIEDHVFFELYSWYDLIINYKRYYRL